MPKLLQIDSCLGRKSTGRITESIARLAMQCGWECYILHGARTVGETVQHHYQVSSLVGTYLHFAESYLLDRHGLGSRLATKRIIKTIEDIRPDIIQLHCIHGYYINYKILFEFLKKTGTPVVWTFHDCWAFTGHCAHFVTANCYKWKNEGCHDCPLKWEYPRSCHDRSKKNFLLKKELFTSVPNLYIITVSNWLASFTKESFFSKTEVMVINNGVDVNVFKPSDNKRKGKFLILGVATAWGRDKGLYDFYKIRQLLPQEQYDITLVGLTEKQIQDLPAGIIGLSRTDSIKELAFIYSEANVLLNPTYADSFPTVNIEALACGTPVITYRTGGSPEIIDEKTGLVVDQGDVEGLIRGIKQIEENPFSPADCRNRAVSRYDKVQRFTDYINLYNSLVK